MLGRADSPPRPAVNSRKRAQVYGGSRLPSTSPTARVVQSSPRAVYSPTARVVQSSPRAVRTPKEAASYVVRTPTEAASYVQSLPHLPGSPTHLPGSPTTNTPTRRPLFSLPGSLTSTPPARQQMFSGTPTSRVQVYTAGSPTYSQQPIIQRVVVAPVAPKILPRERWRKVDAAAADGALVIKRHLAKQKKKQGATYIDADPIIELDSE